LNGDRTNMDEQGQTRTDADEDVKKNDGLRTQPTILIGEGNKLGSFKAKYAWQLPLAGFGGSVAVNFTLKAGGVQGGLALGIICVSIMAGCVIAGVVYSIMGFIKATPKGKMSNKVHGGIGILVSGFLVLMIVGGLMTSARMNKLMRPYVEVDEAVAASYQTVYRDDSVDMVCMLPADYVEAGPDELMIPDALFNYRCDNLCYVFGRKLGGSIQQNQLEFMRYIREQELKSRIVYWGRFDITSTYVYETHLTLGKVVTINVQVPLLPEAIQVSFFGSVDYERQIEDKVGEVLEGIQGHTNWSHLPE